MKEQKGDWPGLDSGLLVRLSPLLEYLEQAARIASEADDYQGMAFSRDHKRQAELSALVAIRTVFERFGVAVTNHKSSSYYTTTKSAEGGDFWQAACVVLNRKPYGHVWDGFMKKNNEMN